MADMNEGDVQAVQSRDREANTNSEHDARPIMEGNFGTQSASSHPVPPALLEAKEYKMSYPKHGKCVIFNYEHFDNRLKLTERTGTTVDAESLKECFSSLGFETDVHKDLTVKETKKTLQGLGKGIDKNDYCFVCCILTHGIRDILYGKDGKFSVQDVIKPFLGDACPNLCGKPKLFFIQACRGDRRDPGAPAAGLDRADSTQTYMIPNHADILVAYSTVPGFLSWRNTVQGSWFIQALCPVLQEQADSMDLLSMLTVVNCHVALKFESPTGEKQVPLVTSSLLRQVWFKPKKGEAHS
uniref:Putative caspase apoptotic cysteine protease n=1 Tax=Rhipicephalus pulchellus TaxID=72859 RepID=L7M0M7_RHIPC